MEESKCRLPEDTPHEKRIRAAVEAHLTTLLKRGDYTSANIRIFGQVPEDVRRHHVRLRDAYAALWQGFSPARKKRVHFEATCISA